GSVSIESALSADCCTEHALPMGLRAHANTCGCIDTPLLQTPIERRPFRETSLTGSLRALPSMLAERASRPPVVGFPVSAALLRDLHSLAARRTVVLLV